MRRLISLAVLLAVGVLVIRLQPDDGASRPQAQPAHDESPAQQAASLAPAAGTRQGAAEPDTEPAAAGGPTGTSTGTPLATKWVTVDRLNRRACPSTACGIVGTLYYRDAVPIYETRAGWARITEPYDAACAWGRSEFIATGNDRCTPENGITDGRLAEWVSAEYLAPDRPPDPAAGAEGTAALVAHSDDYRRHRAAFIQAADTLIARALCTADDFRETGGFTRSTAFASGTVYFTFCGGTTIASRFYLNTVTGEIFQ